MENYRIFTTEEGDYKYFFTDQELFFGQMLAHSDVDGKGTVNLTAGYNTLLPQKAEEMGYRQAHVEMLLSLVGSGMCLPKVVDYLDISGNEMIELMRMDSCVKYRVLIGTKMIAVRQKAADAFIQGYQRGTSEIVSRMEKDGYDISEIARMKALTSQTIRETIQRFQPDGLYEEYMELYGSVT